MIKNNYIVLLVFFIVIIISNQIIIQVDISRQSSDAKTINIAGKQRMFSQQITKMALYASEVKNSPFYNNDIATLERIIDTFKTKQKQLIETNKKQYRNTGVAALFTKNNPYFEQLVSSSENLIKDPDNETVFNNFIVTVKSNEGHFLRTMDAIVNGYQKISESRLNLLKKVQLYFITFTSISLLALLFFMFLPLFRKNKALTSLNEELEKFKQEVKDKEKENVNISNILERLSEIARIGTWEVDLKSNKLLLSKITKEIYGVAPDYELPNMEEGMNFYKEGYSRDKIQEVVAKSIENNEPYDEELELVTQKGKSVWVRTIGEPEYKDGECVRLYGIFQDINKVKQAQLNLKTVNDELNAIFNSGPISILRTDINGIITYFNKGAETLLGYKSEEIVNIHTPAILHKEGELKERAKALSKDFGTEISGFDVFTTIPTRKNTFESRKWTYIRKNGSELIVQLIVNAIKNDTGEIIGYLGVATDITKEVAKETKLLKTKNNLEAASKQLLNQNKQLANFAHITSHNLRSPISNLNSLLTLYDLYETQKEKDEIFTKFRTVISHLTSTLDILVLAISTKQKDIADLELEELYFEKKFIKIKEILSGDIINTNATISADFSQINKITYNRPYLESIMINLVGNALRYSSPDRKLEVKLKSRIKNGMVQLLVSDNGLGIDLEKNGHKIFGLNKVFHRHPDSKGVGLYIVKNQIESLGGSISCVSKINKGSTFIVTFKTN